MFIVNGLTARHTITQYEVCTVMSGIYKIEQPTTKNKVQRTYYNSLEIVKRFENTNLFKLLFFFLQGWYWW